MATFSFSRADRTLTYSPRCGVKYSGRKADPFSNGQTGRWWRKSIRHWWSTLATEFQLLEHACVWLMVITEPSFRALLQITFWEQFMHKVSYNKGRMTHIYLRVCLYPGSWKAMTTQQKELSRWIKESLDWVSNFSSWYLYFSFSYPVSSTVTIRSNINIWYANKDLMFLFTVIDVQIVANKIKIPVLDTIFSEGKWHLTARQQVVLQMAAELQDVHGEDELTLFAACRWSNTAPASAHQSGYRQRSTTGTPPRKASRHL